MRGHHRGRVRAGIPCSTSPGLFPFDGGRASGRSHGHRRESDLPPSPGTLPRDERALLDPVKLKRFLWFCPAFPTALTQGKPPPSFAPANPSTMALTYLILTSTTPCRGTSAVKLPLNVPRSLAAQRSCREAVFFMPTSLKFTVTGLAPSPRLKRPTALLPSARGFIQTSSGPSSDTRWP